VASKPVPEASISCLSAEQRYRAFLNFLPDPVFVFNLDSTVSYLNPAFERVFGWTLRELEGKHIPFVPDHLKEQTREGIRLLFQERVIYGFETQRLTRDGRLLDIVIDGAIFYDENGLPAGQVVTLRDVTPEKRINRVNQAMFRIARALYQFRRLDDRLDFIVREVQELVAVDGASVILLDEERNEFYFRATNFGDSGTGQRMKEIRFPVDKGVAGHVYRTGEPLIVADTSQSPYFFSVVDEETGYQTRSMLDVPIRTSERIIGVLCAVNKKNRAFDENDVELLSAIATTVAYPIENALIHEELKKSYDEVQSLNWAKEKVIHHLSHELKTPVSVLSASLGLLKTRLPSPSDPVIHRILERATRNLNRILEMQYEIEDILRQKDYRAYHMLTDLMEACRDELEVLVEEIGEDRIVDRLRQRIDSLFGPKDTVSEEIDLTAFTDQLIRNIRMEFLHRHCQLETELETTNRVFLPQDVLKKVIVGLIRNAVENTPDQSLIRVRVKNGKSGPELTVTDYGVGITTEDQKLIFQTHVTTRGTLEYSTKKPYDFHAGGRGFDLLRMKIFSERYHFTIRLSSTRCRYIPRNEDLCPGDVGLCRFCSSVQDCLDSGGTTMTVSFTN
jgi:PAS domain S-box-containing protein